MDPYIILASASPRRKELLAQAGFSFVCMPGKGEEKVRFQLPKEVVKDLSRQKAMEIVQRIQDGEQEPMKEAKGHEIILIIGADTIVAYEDAILGKPKDEAQAFATLSMLQGKTHQVYTGVTMAVCTRQEGHPFLSVDEVATFAEKTDVTMYAMSENEIQAYIASGDPMDKAGAYGIQGAFAIHIKSINGDYYNVVGLPIGRLYQEVKVLMERHRGNAAFPEV